MNKFPFGVKSKVIVPLSVKKDGANATFSNRGFYGAYFDQLLFDLQCDHIWGTQAQTLTDDATFYTNGSGNPLDKTDTAVTIGEDDKILINHDVTQTANLLLDAGGKRITLEMMDTVTLDMDTYDLTLGGTGDSIGGDIRITQTGNLVITGNRGLKINNSTGVYEDFKAKELILKLQSNTTVDVDADNIIFVDAYGNGIRIDDIDETYDITADLMSGTSEKASTWYQMWMDSDGVVLMVPDVESVTDGTTASKLVDSAADFVTDLVQIGDIVCNLTDLTQTTVTAIDDLNTLSIADDIFVSGEDYKIRMLSPVGLGHFKAGIGAAYNNSSGNLDKVLKNGRARVTTAFWHTINGYGSSNTKIQKFTTEIDVSDDVVVTVENSATLGFTITANMNCIIGITATMQPDIGSSTGLSKNSTQLTTNLTSIAAEDRLCTCRHTTVNETGISSYFGPAEFGDVFRPHTNGDADGSSPARTSIHITATEII